MNISEALDTQANSLPLNRIEMVEHLLQSRTLLLVGVVGALLVGKSQCFPTQLSAQQIIDKDLGASEVLLSNVVNQIAILKLLNESSTICSLREFPFTVTVPYSDLFCFHVSKLTIT